jgi:hypothetical protein
MRYLSALTHPPAGLQWKLRHALKKLAGKRTPRYADFATAPNPEFRSQEEGTLAKLFFEHEGDVIHKWVHYLPIYESLVLPCAGSDVRMLEIGVSKGGSLALWREALGAKATIFGIDINPKCAEFDGKFANVRIGSQADGSFLKAVVAEMGGLDLVLDDGSHLASHQRASFEVLFPLLSDGGLYFIEDTHTAYWHWFEGGLRRPGTIIEFMKNKIDEMHRHYLEDGRNKAGQIPPIESIQFFDSIIAVRKRKQAPRGHVQIPFRLAASPPGSPSTI